jgi:uncharacterized protein (TIGR03437 family)
LTVRGSNFTPASVVRWNGANRPTTFIDNRRLTATISAADISVAGQAQITVATPPPGGGVAVALSFAIEAPSGNRPAINPGGVVSAASFSVGSGLAPGMVASVFGVNFSSASDGAAAIPLPTSLAGCSIRFNASIPAPEFFVSPLQANLQIPWELSGRESATLTVAVGPEVSEAVVIPLTPFNPGIFSVEQTGAGQAASLIAGTASLAAPLGAYADSRPVKSGEFLVIFATGLGMVTNTPASGREASSSPLSETTTMPQVRLSGIDLPVHFSGLAPGFVGLYQVNVEVRGDVAPSDNAPLQLSIGGRAANAVTIAVE